MTTPTLCWGLVRGEPPVAVFGGASSAALPVGFWKNPPPLRFLSL